MPRIQGGKTTRKVMSHVLSTSIIYLFLSFPAGIEYICNFREKRFLLKITDFQQIWSKKDNVFGCPQDFQVNLKILETDTVIHQKIIWTAWYSMLAYFFFFLVNDDHVDIDLVQAVIENLLIVSALLLG